MQNYNQEVEQLFLGCLLSKDELFDEIAYIKPAHFYYSLHDEIYSKIIETKLNGKRIVPQQLQNEIKSDMPNNYIIDLMNNIIGTGFIKDYAEIIYDLHCKRAIEKLSDDLKNLVNDKSIKAKDILSQTEKFITGAYDINDNSICHITKDIDVAIEENLNPKYGIRTGISAIDNKIMGLKNGCLYIIAARPGMGKTALGLTIGINTAFSNNKTLFMSLEMPLIQLQQRVLLRVKDKKALQVAPLFIDDASGINISTIITKARRQKRKHGLDVLLIDYLGLIAPDDKNMNKVHQIEDITTRLKSLAKELNIPVILLSQLSRAVEMRDDKRPMLSDLRDSGSIEQDADVVAFIYREYYYKKNAFGAEDKKKNSRYESNNNDKNKDAANMADIEAIKEDASIIIAKNRHGESGTLNIRFVAEQQLFCDFNRY